MTRRRFAAGAAVLLAALAAGCATPTKPESMVAARADPVHQSRESVAIAVAGGSETSAVRTAQISDQAFAQALRDSIEKSRLFAGVGDAGTYRLQAFISRVSQPTFGFDMTVGLEVGYTLVDSRSGHPALRKNIATQHTATTGDAIVGVDRVRVATEGAARKNIEQFIDEVSKLRLD